MDTADSACSSTGPTQVCMVVESRDSYAFAACLAYLGHLDGEVTVMGALTMWPRDPDCKVLCVPLQLQERPVPGWPGRLHYSVTHIGPPVATDAKPERYKELSLWADSREDLRGFVHAALAFYRRQTTERGVSKDGVIAYAWDEDAGSWVRTGVRPRRQLNSLYLPRDAQYDLYADVLKFHDEADQLARLHVPALRTYLLHGTPGSGKTSLVHCLASELGFGIARLTFGQGMTDADVSAALARVPPKCLILIEDIDCAFTGRAANSHGVPFASVLAALDGTWSTSPQTVFLTTNHVTALDAALRRRVDYVLQFSSAARDQVREMVAVFCAQPQTPEDVDALWEACRGCSMSLVQKYLVKVRGDPSCAARLDALRELAATAAEAAGPSGLYG